MSADLFMLIDDGEFAEFKKRFLDSPEELSLMLDKQGNSLLTRAVVNEDLRFVELICEFGSNLNYCNRCVGGEPALMYAFDVGNRNIIEKILKKTDLGNAESIKTWMGIPLKERIDEFLKKDRLEM